MTQETFEQWSIVEIMGHQTYAGFVSEQTIGGASFVRVDVPGAGPNGEGAFTKLFGAGSIYCITPTSEEFARAAAARLDARPVSLYVPEYRPRLVGDVPPVDEDRFFEPLPERGTPDANGFDEDDDL